MAEVCVYCGRPPGHGEVVYERTVGWAKRRGATGGANGVRARKTTGDVACGPCVDLLVAGIDPRMGAAPGLF